MACKGETLTPALRSQIAGAPVIEKSRRGVVATS
jgi:hypothetical protein